MPLTINKYTLSFKAFIFCLGSSLFLGACTSVSSLIGGRHKHDYAQNFETMVRYNFSPVPASLAANSDFLFIQNSGATLAIENIMSGKKILKERNMTPDFWLNYYFTGEKTLSVAQLNKIFNYNLGLAWDDKYGTGQGIANSSHIFSRGTLIIDIVSREDNRLIWRGSAPTGISSNDNEHSKRKSLANSIKVILSPFPPQNNFQSIKKPVFDE